jgi:hypothetical protein
MTLSPFAADVECNSAPFPNTQNVRLNLLPNTQIEVNLHCVYLLNTYMEGNNTTLPNMWNEVVQIHCRCEITANSNFFDEFETKIDNI